MFRAHQHKKAVAEFDARHAQWVGARDELAQVLAIAEQGGPGASEGLLLKRGEQLVAEVAPCGLVEDRKGPGHWQGGSQGVSIPIGSLGGHSVRYRVGQSRGHYIQGDPVPTAVDTGTLYVTSQRAVFVGHKQTRECLYAKLLAVDTSTPGQLVFSVSNRQKATVVDFGDAIARAVGLRLKLALAIYQGSVPELVEELRGLLAELDAHEPAPPPPIDD